MIGAIIGLVRRSICGTPTHSQGMRGDAPLQSA